MTNSINRYQEAVGIIPQKVANWVSMLSGDSATQKKVNTVTEENST